MKKFYFIHLVLISTIAQSAKSAYYDYWPIINYPAYTAQVAKYPSKKDYDGTFGNVCYLLDYASSNYGFMIFNGTYGEPKYEGTYLKSRGLPVGYDIDWNGEFDEEHAVYLLNPSPGYTYPSINGIINHAIIPSGQYDIVPPFAHLAGSTTGLSMGLRKTSSVGNCYGVAIYSYQTPASTLKYRLKIFAYDNTFFIPGFEVNDVALPAQFNTATSILDVICMPNSFCVISKNSTNTSRYRIDTYDYAGNYYGSVYRRLVGNVLNYSKFTFLQKGDYFFTIGETNNGVKDRLFIDKISADPLTHVISTGTVSPGLLNLVGGNSVTYTGKFDLINNTNACIEGYIPATGKRVFYCVDKNSFTGISFVQGNQVMVNLEPFMYLPAVGGDRLRTYSIDINGELIIKNFDISYSPFSIVPDPSCYVSNEIQGDFIGGNTLDVFLTGAVQIVGAFESGGILFSSAGGQSVVLMADYDYTNCTGNKLSDTGAVQSISIYPNPATDYLSVSSTENVVGVTAKIYALSGDVVWSDVLHYSNTNLLDIHTLASGVYLLSILANGEMIESKKFIKQ